MVLAVHGATAEAAGNPYAEQRAYALKTCAAIDPAEYQSGLLFNPDGYRSYYRRSACFQDAAARFRDEKLCGEVKQRRSLLSSSWGYSAKRCRELVADGLAADRKELEALRSRYAKGAVRLRDFRIERNGPVLLESMGFHLDGRDDIRIFVRQADIRNRFVQFEPGQRYRVRGTITLSVGYGGQNSMRSDAFIERVFPAAERSRFVEKDVTF
jgi:hypothetical protein